MNESEKPTPKALILIADGTEEMEFTITFDTLIRGGFECTSAFVTSRRFGSTSPPQTQISEATFHNVSGGGDPKIVLNAPVATCSRGMKIMADLNFGNEGKGFGPDEYDLLVIPGGLRGAQTMMNDYYIPGLVNDYLNAKKWVGMICAGSMVARHANLKRQPITSHPTVRSELETAFDYSEESVVVSDHLVTSRGPGSTFPFALKLIELIQGEEKRIEVIPPMMFPRDTPL